MQPGGTASAEGMQGVLGGLEEETKDQVVDAFTEDLWLLNSGGTQSVFSGLVSLCGSDMCAHICDF